MSQCPFGDVQHLTRSQIDARISNASVARMTQAAAALNFSSRIKEMQLLAVRMQNASICNLIFIQVLVHFSLFSEKIILWPRLVILTLIFLNFTILCHLVVWVTGSDWHSMTVFAPFYDEVSIVTKIVDAFWTRSDQSKCTVKNDANKCCGDSKVFLNEPCFDAKLKSK